MKKLIVLALMSAPVFLLAQSSLTIEKIMQDPKWIGTSPSNPFWNAGSDTLFFYWNPEGNVSDSLYFITLKNTTPQKVTIEQQQSLRRGEIVRWNKNNTAAVYIMKGDIFYETVKPAKTIRVTHTTDFESNAAFAFNDTKIAYQSGQNLFAWDIATGQITQLTNFVNSDQQSGARNSQPTNAAEKWLANEQLQYIQVLKERKEKSDARRDYNEKLRTEEFKKLVTGNKRMMGLALSPDGRNVSYALTQPATSPKNTIVPNYVTESGYTTDIPGRSKVGTVGGSTEFYVYDRVDDTLVAVDLKNLEGIHDIPEFYKDYPDVYEKLKKENKPRVVSVGFRSAWSPDGKHLLFEVRSQDHKDRWLLVYNADSKTTTQADRQHDEAWIGGPGMFNLGWVDETTLYYQSEKTGYSHLYLYDVNSKTTRQLTSGNYEVQSASLSPDQKYFYITTNENDPGQTNLYKLRISDGKQEKITTMPGGNKVTISPDGKQVAILNSYSNKPWELYLQKNEPGSKPVQITDRGMSDEFKAYPWRAPEVVAFPARDGAKVYARVYKPNNPRPGMPAVVFVHGAGYLQDAHKWWSDSYFREYMFHNLLADNGYYVIAPDYRASSGYGRDWRTAIYRHMGGWDLTDNVDAAKYLVDTYGVDAKRVGVYGGSYGGFITLMGMFTTPDVFAAGAGLRSVTEWANYNDGYTSNILNDPFNDSLAYRRSSPIYFAEGLKGHLLMCHGLIDVNVHAQDIIKLTQRLIELKKENWELALYPLEDHGFVEPTSWMDEYKRIFKLFETVLKK
ncbi:MAG: S9 family peptidase [Chitinophagaceae bacterium]|nr:S9 family peptidase [Chitinophagaceae bacterium]